MKDRKFTWSVILGIVFTSLALLFLVVYVILSCITDVQERQTTGESNPASMIVAALLLGAYFVLLMIFGKKIPAWALGTINLFEGGASLILGIALLFGTVFVIALCAGFSNSASSVSSSVETSISSVVTSSSSGQGCSEEVLNSLGTAGAGAITAAILAIPLVVASFVSAGVNARWQWFVLLGATALSFIGIIIACFYFLKIPSFAYATLFLACGNAQLGHVFFLFESTPKTINPAEVH